MTTNSERDYMADRAAPAKHFEPIEPVLNPSGLVPVEYKVLIKLDPVEEKTVGGIIIPDNLSERHQQAETYATLIAVGGNAFTDPDWRAPIPKPGDKIVVDKYAGEPLKAGDIENLYRLCNDKDICAIRFFNSFRGS